MANIQLQLRGDTAANWTSANPILASREVGIETDTHQIKIGDGSTAWASLPYGGIQGATGTVSGNTGTATLDFGSIPGADTTFVVIGGQSSILATSQVQCWIQGTDSTPDHNAYEHTMIPINVRCSNIIIGTSFTITATTEYRLTGTFKCRYLWI